MQPFIYEIAGTDSKIDDHTFRHHYSMKVVYTAPNRGHHFKYAAALFQADCLRAFVSGYPRISKLSQAPELGGKLYHSDILQTIYIASLKGGLPVKASNYLAYLSKIEQDYACRKFVKSSDIFLFYSGSGLNTCRYGKKTGIINIVEAVNSHVEYQEEILKEEFKNIHLPWKPFPKKEKERRLREYEEADYILLPSEFVKRSFLAKGFPANKLLKVPYGFNKALDATQVIKCENDLFTVLYVGSISVRKGIRYLVEAFKQLQHPNKRLLLVGPDVHDGALNGIVLSANIIFTGVLKGTELEAAYTSANVFCLPSIEEGLALVLGESLSHGLPIITTCNTGADDIITDGIEGFIVAIKNSESIHCKLQMIADDPDLLENLRSNACIKAGKLNGWEETGKMLVNTLQSVHIKNGLLN